MPNVVPAEVFDERPESVDGVLLIHLCVVTGRCAVTNDPATRTLFFESGFGLSDRFPIAVGNPVGRDGRPNKLRPLW